MSSIDWARSALSCWYRADLLQQPKHIWLAMFFNELTARQTVDIHGLHRDYFSRWRDAKECTPMSAPHCEPCGHLVAFSNTLLQSPLSIGEASAHHPDDSQVASRIAHRLGMPRYMKYRIGRNEFLSKHLAGSVDELQEAVHNDLVGFCGAFLAGSDVCLTLLLHHLHLLFVHTPP